MNKEQLLAKIQALKETKEAQTTPAQIVTPQAQPESAPAETIPQGISPLESFKIIWHEGTGEFEGVTVKTWNEAQKMMLSIWDNEQKYTPDGCYTKMKICVKWVNGKEITDRCDIGTNGSDFNPSLCSIGEYLSKCAGVMYASNLQQGERVNLSFKDAENTTAQPVENKTNLSEIPETLKKLLGIVETIEEANDNSETALIQASEQVERCKAYITYLRSILPILEAKTEGMINAKHQPKAIEIKNHSNFHLN